jgi:hypothetical protein
VVVAFAARELRKPVRFTAERIEEFLGASHGRDVVSKSSSRSMPMAGSSRFASRRSRT